MIVGREDFAIPTFPFEMEYLPALSPGNLPAGMLSVLVGYATGVNMFRATQKIPAWGFSNPEICHFISLSPMVFYKEILFEYLLTMPCESFSLNGWLAN